MSFLNLEPEEFSTPNDEPKKPRKAYTKKKVSVKTDAGMKAFSQNVMVLSTLLANKSEIAELAIGLEESEALAQAIGVVIEEYDFTLDSKTQAWLNLASVVGAISVKRVITYKARKIAEAEAEAKEKEGEQ